MTGKKPLSVAIKPPKNRQAAPDNEVPELSFR